MSPEAQRIAIAEVCGYRHGESKPFWMATPIGQPFVACSVDKLPDYLNDLNAMHETEKKLQPLQHRTYWEQLALYTKGVGMYPGEATASQRAEAFLRTLGKWVPDE